MTAEQQATLNKIIWIDRGRLSGEPCFRGTRVPVQVLIDHLEENFTIKDFLKGFPAVGRSQVVQFIGLAKDHLLACVSG